MPSRGITNGTDVVFRADATNTQFRTIYCDQMSATYSCMNVVRGTLLSAFELIMTTHTSCDRKITVHADGNTKLSYKIGGKSKRGKYE